MKTIILNTILLILLPICVISKPISSPSDGKNSTIYIHEICKYHSSLILKKIEFGDEKTIITMEFRQTNIASDSHFVFISTMDSLQTYTLQNLLNGKKYRAYRSNVGLTYDAPTYMKQGEVLDIELEFPPILGAFKEFTLSEKMHGGNWGFYSLNLEDYINNTPNNIIYAKNSTLELLKNKDYKTAYRSIKTYLTQYPEDADGYNLAGTIAFENGDSKKAEKYILQALSLSPKNHSFYDNLCALYRMQENMIAAMQCLDSAILYCPDYPDFYEARASWYFQQEHYTKAIADYNMLIGFHRYTLKRPWMYCYRAEAKIMIDDATACEDIKLALKYAKTGFGEGYFELLRKTHCGREKRL